MGKGHGSRPRGTATLPAGHVYVPLVAAVLPFVLYGRPGLMGRRASRAGPCEREDLRQPRGRAAEDRLRLGLYAGAHATGQGERSVVEALRQMTDRPCSTALRVCVLLVKGCAS